MAEIKLEKTKDDIWPDKGFDTEDFPSNKKKLNDLHKLLLYALTVRTMGMPVAFTIKFTNTTRARIDSDDCNVRNFVLEMARKFCKDMEMFFVLEYVMVRSGERRGKYDWHVHGVYATSLQAIEQDKDRLRKLCGDKRKGKTRKEKEFYKNHALKIKFTTHFKARGKYVGLRGWADYLSKDLSRTNLRSDFEGTLIGKTDGVCKKSKEVLNEIYEQKASLRKKKHLPPPAKTAHTIHSHMF